MLNLAGNQFDYGSVVFAVLQECEHHRLSVDDADLEAGLMAVAREKLDEAEAAYFETGGSKGYWEELRCEVLETVMPKYIPAALRRNQLERSGFEVWREGDILSRASFALAGLAIGGIIVALPFIPIFEDMFAFALGFSGWFYPELKKGLFDYRHSRLLNNLITESQRYQENARIHYMTTQQIQESFQPADLDELLKIVPDPVHSSEESETTTGAAIESAKKE
ncbi:MAG TPA: hypothetical protein VHL58_13995 [Thermoanaerobaculia bacterium]|nr:hypothetical protein [Thermoanaerobaculia bacterium]